jgi:hypothetical protein
LLRFARNDESRLNQKHSAIPVVAGAAKSVGHDQDF